MNLIQIIDEIQASHQYVNNIIEYDDKYDLVEYKGKLIVIEKEQDEGTAFFFVRVLTKSILTEIKAICTKLGFANFIIQGFISNIEDSHFVKVENKQ